MPLKGAEPRKMAIFGHFWLKSPFLTISGLFSPVATGLFSRFLAKNGQNPQKAGKIPDSGIPGRGFYINPSPRGPEPRIRGPGVPGSRGALPPGAGEPLPEAGILIPDPGIPGRSRRPPREASRGAPAPLGGAPEGLFYINPSRRGPAVPARGPGRQSRPGAPPRRPPGVGGYKVVG